MHGIAAPGKSIGFAVFNTFEDDGELNFALLGYGSSQLMLTGGGHPSEVDRRDVDLCPMRNGKRATTVGNKDDWLRRTANRSSILSDHRIASG